MKRICVEYLSPDDIRPYENNPRKNKKAIDAVAASIKEYGFNSPILIQEDGTIINGHTRWKAAKKLNLTAVPVVRAEGLTEEQIKKYRLIDNKTSELAEWDKDLLAKELESIDFGDLDFDFDFDKDLKSHGWGSNRIQIPCELTEASYARKCVAGYYHPIFDSNGGTLDDIKTEDNVKPFAESVIQHLLDLLGKNLASWCIVTTPRRRHAEGFHFATEICKAVSKECGIPFYPDAVKCRNRHRVGAVFDLIAVPKEQNVILYDDIITTGSTLKATREALNEAGKTTLLIVSIDNHLIRG